LHNAKQDNHRVESVVRKYTLKLHRVTNLLYNRLATLMSRVWNAPIIDHAVSHVLQSRQRHGLCFLLIWFV